MTKFKGEDIPIIMPPELQAEIDAKGLADAVREMNARLRQALDGVDLNDPVAVEAAMRSIGAVQVELDDEEDE